MALTGDLAQLHITDIIQLIHTTRQSGNLSVAGSKGESRIIFSNGYIVGANHLSSRVRIGSVLVGMKAITSEDLQFALDTQKKAGVNRSPLVSTLKQLGRLKDDAAFKALKKLIEITVVELISWKEGTFTFDADAIAVSADCRYHPGEMEQEQSFDAQMVLMDALRVFDERERDRMSGAAVPTDEDLYAEVLPSSSSSDPASNKPVITADILGLADLDQLENRIPVKVVVSEEFDPVTIHRRIIRRILNDFPAEEQEKLVVFLKDATDSGSYYEGTGRQNRHAMAVILFSGDELLTHSLMTVCKNDGISIFGVSQETDIERVIEQCYKMSIQPVLVFDAPDEAAAGLSETDMTAGRLLIRSIHPHISFVQLLPPGSYQYALHCLGEGVRTIFPKPDRMVARETFIADMIMFLEAFRNAARCILIDPNASSATEMLSALKEKTAALRLLEDLDEVSSLLFETVSSAFERSVLFFVEGPGLAVKKTLIPAHESSSTEDLNPQLAVPLGKYSVFDDVVESGQAYYGESDDEVLHGQIFQKIGEPRNRKVFVLPLKVSGQVKVLIYADFGQKEVASAFTEAFEVLAVEAGLILENTSYRQQILKTTKK
ncbi:MAG: DUF4388 domain-containing protein [Nitrospirae bacterium]|nr:DUF4388 domain-containing protein [Nitrospirota bacterium]